MNSTINTFSPSFQGKLILNDKTIIHDELAKEVLNNKTLQDFAAQSTSDIFISQSVKTAKSNDKNHYKGESLYKVFLSKEDKSILGKIKQVFGLNKVSLSRNYHTPQTFFYRILNSSYLETVTKKLSMK